MIFSLSKQVQIWVNKGIITPDQATKILSVEPSSDRKSWVFYGISGVGLTALLTGCISIVAANWHEISDLVKLLSYFSLQIVLGVAVLFTAKRNYQLATDLLSVLFAGFFLVGIALIGQVFHLRSDGWKAGVFWLGLTLPMFASARSKILSHFWICASFITGGAWLLSNKNFTANSEQEFLMRVSVLGCWPIVLMATSFVLESQNKDHYHHLKSTIRNWAMVVHLVVTSLFAIYLWGNHKLGFDTIQNLVPPWTCSLIAIGLNYFRRDVSILGRHLFAALIVCIGVNVSIPALINLDLGREVVSILSAVLFILVWAVAAATAAVFQRKLLFDLASLAIAFRFVVIYFEIFGDLSTTGVGLILTGVIILAVAFVWYQLHRKVAVSVSMSTKESLP